MFISNPITDFYRKVVEDYWRSDSIGDPRSLNSAELRLHRTALNLIIKELEPLTFTRFGAFIRLEFERPPRVTC